MWANVASVVAFDIGGTRFGLPLADTLELLRMPSVVLLPKAPAIVEGIVNVRGKIVPVLDIRTRFRLAAKKQEPSDYLILATIDKRVVAFRVDRVLGLVDLKAAEITQIDMVLSNTQYVAGVALAGDGLILIHDLRTFLVEAEALHIDDALQMFDGVPA